MNAKEAFLDYTGRFDTADNKIRLKILHTLEVVRVMERLTGMLGLEEEQRSVAEKVAMFHDIGRFEQVTMYHTFSDQTSVDHAALGCRVLQEEHILEELPKRQQEQILTAIRNHNQYVIGDGPDEETLLYCKLIRDADKIDILRVFATEDPMDTMGESQEQVAEEEISDDVFERIMARGQIPKAIRKTGLDFWVGFTGFVYGLYFDESRAIIAEDRYYRKRFDETAFVLPKTRERVAQFLAQIDSDLPA